MTVTSSRRVASLNTNAPEHRPFNFQLYSCIPLHKYTILPMHVIRVYLLNTKSSSIALSPTWRLHLGPQKCHPITDKTIFPSTMQLHRRTRFTLNIYRQGEMDSDIAYRCARADSFAMPARIPSSYCTTDKPCSISSSNRKNYDRPRGNSCTRDDAHSRSTRILEIC